MLYEVITHMPVHKEDGVQRLVLGGRSDIAFDGQMRQVSTHIFEVQRLWFFAAKIRLKLAEPAEISLLGIQGKLLDAQNVPGLVESAAPCLIVCHDGYRGWKSFGEEIIETPESLLGLFHLPGFTGLLQIGKKQA